MNGLETFLANHSIWDTIVIFWIVSAAVNALPEPSETSAAWYRWIYTFLTTLVGHLHDAINQRKQAKSPSASS